MSEGLVLDNELTAGWSVATRAQLLPVGRSPDPPPRKRPRMPIQEAPQMNFSLLGMRIASLIGLIAMAALPTEFYITLTTAITVTGSIVLQILVIRENKRRYERGRQEATDRYERDRQERIDHQDELKLEIARVATLTSATGASLAHDIRANSALTAEVGAKADAAYDAANHVDEKIAKMQSGAPHSRSSGPGSMT